MALAAGVDFATGRLCIRAYSPYPWTDWSQSWKEAKQGSLRGQLDEIVQQLTDAAPVIARLVEEAEEQARIRQQEGMEQIRRREERERIRLGKCWKPISKAIVVYFGGLLDGERRFLDLSAHSL